MQSNLIFLGTGQGAQVVGKQHRGSGGIIIQSRQTQLHVDPGPGSLVMARNAGINPRETTGVLVSHHHLHHCNDVNAVIDAMTHGGLDRHGILVATDTLINGDAHGHPYLTKFHKECIDKFMVLKARQRAAIDDIEIRATSACHNTETIGFQLSAPDFTLSYLADTALCPELLEEHKESDILILNVVNPGDLKTAFNLNTEAAIQIIEKLAPRLAIITHFSQKMLESDPLIEARMISQRTKAQVIAAKDGLTINPYTYSTIRKQKTLRSY